MLLGLVWLFVSSTGAQTQGNTQTDFLNWLSQNPSEQTPPLTSSNSTSGSSVEFAGPNVSIVAPLAVVSSKPTSQPSMASPLPVMQPSAVLASKPTHLSPTSQPTPVPTSPTPNPTLQKTRRPTTVDPTNQPVRKSTASPTLAPTTASPTIAPIVQPNLQYRLRNAIFTDKCLTVAQPADENAGVLAPCLPPVPWGNQSFDSIPQTPPYFGAIVDPTIIQLVRGFVWTWVYPLGPKSPNLVRLTDSQVYGTSKQLNLSSCISIPKMEPEDTYPTYFFPCIVNASNIWFLEPILANGYTTPPSAPPQSKPSVVKQLANNAPYGQPPPANFTPPPLPTCVPVHMEHIGRHGSRHATDLNAFMVPVQGLVSASRVNALTPFGQKLLAAANQVVFNVRNIPVAELTSQGQSEIYNYTTRMIRNFPSIFTHTNGNETIVADSTVYDRTLFSRKQAFYALRDSGINVSALVSSFNPSLCTIGYNILQGWLGCRGFVIYENDDTMFFPSSELKFKTMANSSKAVSDFWNSVFVEGWEIPQNVAQNGGRSADRIKFADDIWRQLCQVAAAYNLTDYANSICSLIPYELAELLAYNEDVVQYRSYGRYNPTMTSFQQSCLLHNDVVTGFEKYVAGDKSIRAHFRFGHMETLLPYYSAMGFAPRDPYYLQDVDWRNREWNTYWVRMASNIQQVLYKCGDTYYVKMLLNEVETVIPGCGNVYCPWEKYKALAASWRCTEDQFKQNCNGLIVFCGDARSQATSQQWNPGEVPAGPPSCPFGSSPFDQFGPFGSVSAGRATRGGLRGESAGAAFGTGGSAKQSEGGKVSGRSNDGGGS